MRAQIKRTLVMVLMLTMVIQACWIDTAMAGDLGILVLGDFIAGEGVSIYWNTDTPGAEHYDCTVLNTTTGKYVQERKTSRDGYSCSLSGSKIEAGKHKVWVGAVAKNGDVLNDQIKYFTVSEKKSASTAGRQALESAASVVRSVRMTTQTRSALMNIGRVSLTRSTNLHSITTLYVRYVDLL